MTVKKIAPQTLEEFYNFTGAKIGWNFEKIKCLSEGISWDFYKEVVKHSGKNKNLLDIGTGGGEKILAIVDKFQNVIGIDSSEEMIKTARKNLNKNKNKNVRFFVMNSKKVFFPDKMFDVISCRHSEFSPSEVHRLLTDKGIFLSQQVGENDKNNLKKCFGRGQNWKIKDGSAVKKYFQKLWLAGFSEVEYREYNAVEYYQSPKDLLFLLKYTSIIPNFGQVKDDLEKFGKFIKENKSKKGTQTNSKRYLLIAKK